MSEHWKSTPKYWCKHCSTYVKDTPFERKQHESTGKHQGNLKRFLQGIQKDHVKNEREKEKTAAEIKRLNRLTGTDSSSSTPPLSNPASSKPSKSTSSTLSAADQKRQWAQLAEMGIAVPDHARAEMAMAGDWQITSRRTERELSADEKFDDKLNIGIRKRKFEDDDEKEEAGETVFRKGWGSTTKSYPDANTTAEALNTLLTGSLSRKSAEAPSKGLEPSDNASKTKSDIQVSEDSNKHESPSAANQEPSKGQEPSQNLSPDPSDLSSNIKTEVTEDDLKVDNKIDPLPVFKKRKARQPLAATIT